MKLLFCLLLLLTSELSYSLNNPEAEVFRKVLDTEIALGATAIYIGCEKPGTVFSRTGFIENTGLEVPLIILQEIEKNTSVSTDGQWDSELIANIRYGADVMKSKACISAQDAMQLFEKTGQRQSILTISNPIFDNKYEHCVVTVTYLKFKGSAFGHSYFLKKVYGSWTIITTYDSWLS